MWGWNESVWWSCTEIHKRKPQAIRGDNISGVWILIFLCWRRRRRTKRNTEWRSKSWRSGTNFYWYFLFGAVAVSCGPNMIRLSFLRFRFLLFFSFSHMMKSFPLRESSGILSVFFMFSWIPPVCLFVCVVPLLYKLFCFFLFVFYWLLFKRRKY